MLEATRIIVTALAVYYAGNDETNDTAILNEKYFCHGNAHSEWETGRTASSPPWIMHTIRSLFTGKFGAKRKKPSDKNIRHHQFLSNDTLHFIRSSYKKIR